MHVVLLPRLGASLFPMQISSPAACQRAGRGGKSLPYGLSPPPGLAVYIVGGSVGAGSLLFCRELWLWYVDPTNAREDKNKVKIEQRLSQKAQGEGAPVGYPSRFPTSGRKSEQLISLNPMAT